MGRAFEIFDIMIKGLLLVLCIALIIVGSAQIITRYLLEVSLMWSEELIRFLFIFTTFLGVPIGVIEGRHPAVDLLPTKIPPRYLKSYKLVLNSLIGIVFVVMLVYGTKYAVQNGNYYSAAMGIRMTYILSIIPIGGAIGLIYWFKHMSNIWKGVDK